jgi:hypothetical protein
MDKQQGLILQLGGWAWGLQPFTIKKEFVKDILNEPRTWMNSLDE